MRSLDRRLIRLILVRVCLVDIEHMYLVMIHGIRIGGKRSDSFDGVSVF